MLVKIGNFPVSLIFSRWIHHLGLFRHCTRHSLFCLQCSTVLRTTGNGICRVLRVEIVQYGYQVVNTESKHSKSLATETKILFSHFLVMPCKLSSTPNPCWRQHVNSVSGCFCSAELATVLSPHFSYLKDQLAGILSVTVAIVQMEFDGDVVPEAYKV